jgi:hypothetical protein
MQHTRTTCIFYEAHFIHERINNTISTICELMTLQMKEMKAVFEFVLLQTFCGVTGDRLLRSYIYSGVFKLNCYTPQRTYGIQY